MGTDEQTRDAKPRFRVRRLAVIDLHGSGGTRLRRVVIRIEFAGAVVIGVSLAILFFRAGSISGIILGLVSAGIAANYLVLVVWAVALRDPSRLGREFSAHDVAIDGRYQSLCALLLFVPYLFLPLALRPIERQV